MYNTTTATDGGKNEEEGKNDIIAFKEQQLSPDEFVQRHGENHDDHDHDNNNHQYIRHAGNPPYHHFDSSHRHRIGDGDGDGADAVAFKRELIMNPQEHLQLYRDDDDDDHDMETDVAVRGDNMTFTSQRSNIEDNDHVAFKREQVMNPQDHLRLYRHDSSNEVQHNDNPLLRQQQEHQQYNTEYAAVPSEYVCPVNSHLHTIAPNDPLADTSGVQPSNHGGRHDHSATGILVLSAAPPLTVPAAPLYPSNSTFAQPAESSSSHDTSTHSHEEDGSGVNISSSQHHPSSKKRQPTKFKSFFQRFRRSATR